MTQARVLLALFMAVLCVSTSSIFVRFCSAPALVIAFYRLGFTALFGGLLSLGTKQKWQGLGGHLSRVIIAGIFLALHFGVWITSLSFTSIASAVLFVNMQVIFVIILSAVFLKEKIKPGVGGGVVLALVGSFFIGGGDLMGGHLSGDLLALAGGFFFAVYLLIGRGIRSEAEIWPYTAVVSSVAMLTLAVGVFWSGLPMGGYRPANYLWFVLMALLPGLGGHAVFNWALKYVQAPVVAVSILGESVGASFLGFVIFHESLAWFQILGGILVLSGLYYAISRESKER